MYILSLSSCKVWQHYCSKSELFTAVDLLCPAGKSSSLVLGQIYKQNPDLKLYHHTTQI